MVGVAVHYNSSDLGSEERSKGHTHIPRCSATVVHNLADDNLFPINDLLKEVMRAEGKIKVTAGFGSKSRRSTAANGWVRATISLSRR